MANVIMKKKITIENINLTCEEFKAFETVIHALQSLSYELEDECKSDSLVFEYDNDAFSVGVLAKYLSNIKYSAVRLDN